MISVFSGVIAKQFSGKFSPDITSEDEYGVVGGNTPSTPETSFSFYFLAGNGDTFVASNGDKLAMAAG